RTRQRDCKHLQSRTRSMYTLLNMKCSRRDLAFLMPMLAAAQAPSGDSMQPSVTLNHDDIPARKSGTIGMRQMLKGNTHSGFQVDLHKSELPAGEAPHPPHHHVHEEL